MATLAANTLIHAHIQIARAHLKPGMHCEVTCVDHCRYCGGNLIIVFFDLYCVDVFILS